jgi:hypothetical protein
LTRDLECLFKLRRQKGNELLKSHILEKEHNKTIPKESGEREYREWEDVWLVNGAKVKRET